MIIDVAQLYGSSVLAGAVNGKSFLMKLLAETMTEPTDPTQLYLNFDGVEVATASFMREAIVAFRDIIRRRKSNFYPIIANANADVRDEIVEVLNARGDVMMICNLSESQQADGAEPIGNLDVKQRRTYDVVNEHGETDAGALMREYGESENLRHATAWNNRLASLASLGLIFEVSEGRSKRYRRLF